MSALDFLSPSRARPEGTFFPHARSSMDRRQRDAGATFELRDGWIVPVSLPDEAEHLTAVGIADLSHLGKLELGGPAPDVDALVRYVISPRRTLLLCETARTASLHDEIAAQGAVLDVTSALGVLALVGPEAETLVRRLTHLDAVPSSGEVAHVTPVHLLPRPGGGVLLVFPQESGHYLWEVAVDRALPLGGGPVGVDAIGGGLE